MRCRECNIDLPDNYTACPLCSSAVFDDECLIKDIRTAEYPRAKAEPLKRNPFPIFILIWFVLSAVSFVLYKCQIIEPLAAASVFCVVPCIWTLLVRPFLIKQLYEGNFIIMNLFPFALSSVVLDKIINGSLSKSFETYLPLCALLVFVALLLLVFIKPKKSKRAASYPVLMLPISAVAIIVLSITEREIPYLWCAVLVLCVFILLYLLLTKPQETKDELCAKFSIQ